MGRLFVKILLLFLSLNFSNSVVFASSLVCKRASKTAGLFGSPEKDYSNILQTYLESIARYSLLNREKEVAIGREREDLAIDFFIALEDQPLLLKSIAQMAVINSGQTTNKKFKTFYELDSQSSPYNLLAAVTDDRPGTVEFLSGMMSAAKEFEGFDIETKKKIAPILGRWEKLREDLANANLRLVVSIAKSYVNRGIPLIDLIGAGNEGLLVAVDRWDFSKGNKFSTFATWWVKQHIGRLVEDQQSVIRVPAHMNAKDQKDNPLRADVRRARRIRDIDAPNKKTDDGKSFAGNLQDANLPPVFARIEQENFTSLLEKVLPNILSDKEWIVIQHVYGLNGASVLTLQKIGDILDGLTRARIGQIKDAALEKLRAYFAKTKLYADEFRAFVFYEGGSE